MVIGDTYKAGGAQDWGPRATLPILAPTDLPFIELPGVQAGQTCPDLLYDRV